MEGAARVLTLWASRRPRPVPAPPAARRPPTLMSGISARPSVPPQNSPSAPLARWGIFRDETGGNLLTKHSGGTSVVAVVFPLGQHGAPAQRARGAAPGGRPSGRRAGGPAATGRRPGGGLRPAPRTVWGQATPAPGPARARGHQSPRGSPVKRECNFLVLICPQGLDTYHRLTSTRTRGSRCLFFHSFRIRLPRANHGNRGPGNSTRRFRRSPLSTAGSGRGQRPRDMRLRSRPNSAGIYSSTSSNPCNVPCWAATSPHSQRTLPLSVLRATEACFAVHRGSCRGAQAKTCSNRDSAEWPLGTLLAARRP